MTYHSFVGWELQDQGAGGGGDLVLGEDSFWLAVLCLLMAGREHVLSPPLIKLVKTLSPTAEDTGAVGSVPGSGRAPGAGNGNPPHYSYLENPMDREAW